MEFLEVLGSQVFLARQEIWDPKDSKEQGEEEVKRVTEVRWDCQEEKEIRAKSGCEAFLLIAVTNRDQKRVIKVSERARERSDRAKLAC